MPHPRPVALVTGAARRIGATIARKLHAEGYDLALHYHRSEQEMQTLLAEFDAVRPGSAYALRADLTEFDRLPELVAHSVGRYGRLDALVNNASGYYATPFGEVTPTQWDDLFATNARAPFFLAQAAAPHLAAAGEHGGAIVNIVDIYAERPLPRHPVYCMAKAALAMMTRSLAAELGPRIRVNGIAPGNILWSDNPVKAETIEIVQARTALRRQGAPEDIAQAVAYCLASPYLTGQIIAIDGGRSLFI
ncbi:MAG: pteridine reductase [Lysobacteraceae bacterium]|nr:MAG: pteridine reductase [Xanthomonadaceae bacterium]